MLQVKQVSDEGLVIINGVTYSEAFFEAMKPGIVLEVVETGEGYVSVVRHYAFETFLKKQREKSLENYFEKDMEKK